MSWASISEFSEQAKGIRGQNPQASLGYLGAAATRAVADAANFDVAPIAFHHPGEKEYQVYFSDGGAARFSRPVRPDLFISSPAEFSARWGEFSIALADRRGQLTLDLDGGIIDRVIYTAVMSFAVCSEIFGQGGRGAPGTFFEMVVGPAVAELLDWPETSTILIPVDGGNERVPVDLSFIPAESDVALVVPTKISTRERISQAYVHQRILSTAKPHGKEYRSVLGIVNETNVIAPKGIPPAQRTPDVCWVQETLVKRTILLYQKYVAELSGLYYLDPPNPYLNAVDEDFPPVRRLHHLLVSDLPDLVEQS